MLHERLIANETQLVALHDEVVYLKQQLRSMSINQSAAHIAVSLFAETMLCGRGREMVFSESIVTPEVLRLLKFYKFGIVHDTANHLYVMGLNIEMLQNYLDLPYSLNNALQRMCPDKNYELSQTVLIQPSRFGQARFY